jgi:hypothetical protein
MAKLSLLEMTQDILNDLESDEVDAISDTVEALQVAQIIKTSYFEMMASRNWPHLKRTVTLDALVDPSRPTHLRLPELTKELIMFSYNKRKDGETKDYFTEMKWMEPEHFLRHLNRRNVDNDNIIKVTDTGGIPLYIRTDKQPEYYTSFDDDHIVLDSYNSALEATLQTTNSQALIYFEPSWVQTDNAIPDLPSEAFPALLAEAKSTAFLVLKQQANEKAEQKSVRQQRWLSRKAWRVSGGVRYPDYGRKRTSPSARRNPLIDKDVSVTP